MTDQTERHMSFRHRRRASVLVLTVQRRLREAGDRRVRRSPHVPDRDLASIFDRFHRRANVRDRIARMGVAAAY